MELIIFTFGSQKTKLNLCLSEQPHRFVFWYLVLQDF